MNWTLIIHHKEISLINFCNRIKYNPLFYSYCWYCFTMNQYLLVFSVSLSLSVLFLFYYCVYASNQYLLQKTDDAENSVILAQFYVPLLLLHFNVFVLFHHIFLPFFYASLLKNVTCHTKFFLGKKKRKIIVFYFFFNK